MADTRAKAQRAQREETASPPYPFLLHDIGLHDPFILADPLTHRYYLYNASYCTTDGYTHADASSVGLYMDHSDGVYCFVSCDLIHWSRPTLVFNLHDQPAGARRAYSDQQGPWAPEVHFWRGKWWMFVTLHNPNIPIGQPWRGPEWYLRQKRDSPCTARGVYILRADSPMGPFVPVHPDRPTTDPARMCLDGTLAIDKKGQPWMIYAHEWVQMFDGTMEAIRLDPTDLSTALDPKHPAVLWEASQAPWHEQEGDAPKGGWKGNLSTATANGYVTDGPYVVRMSTGALACLWTSYSRGVYTLTQALSPSGTISGPWKQLSPLLRNDCGHGMIFHDFAGQTFLFMHSNMTRQLNGRPLLSHGVLYRIALRPDGIRILAHASDLDGIADPAHDQ